MEAQGIAVAEAVGLPYSLKRVRVTAAMRLVPARLRIYMPPRRLLDFCFLQRASRAALATPHHLDRPAQRPHSTGAQSVAKAFALHIQNPKVPKQRFDLIAAPLRDGYTGKNVINTFGAVHSVTPKRLAEAAQSFEDRTSAPPAHRGAARRRQRGLQLPAGSRRLFRRVAGRGRA
jgi:mitochondrial fission protein ELM1